MALLTACAIITTGCAGSDETVTDQPKEHQGSIITMTANVSLDNGGTTRALTPNTGVKTFAAGEKITVAYIAGDGKVYNKESVALTATDISADGHHATFTVTFSGGGSDPLPAANGKMRVIYPSGMAARYGDGDYDPSDDSKTINPDKLAVSQNGRSSVLSQSLDLATFDGEMTAEGTLPAQIPLSNRLAILELTVENSGGTVINGSIKRLVINDGTYTYTVGDGTSTTFPTPMYVAVWPFADKSLFITATDGTNNYVKIVSSATLERNTINPVNLTMAPGKVVNLAALTDADVSADGEYILQNGDVLSGTLDGSSQKYKISIADGATVMLRNATINGVHTDDSHELWAGLTCLGEATIILEGTNTMQNFNRHYPGLQPGPENTTLTILGSGSLTATASHFGAGIGTKDNGGSCGNIRIEGGTVTANGGSSAAGIGSSNGSTCGDITICGSAHVTATGSDCGAGIGSGNGDSDYLSKCGNIIIEGSAQVTANGGENGAGIGSGYGDEGGNSQCGDITIRGSVQVTATGGEKAAGIGTGYKGKSGSISIEGGTVMAKGGENATGIGTGKGEYSDRAECGAISITKDTGFVSVTAIRGSGASRSIGTPYGRNDKENKCGSIKFESRVVFDGIYDDYVVPGEGDYNGLSFTISTTNVPEGINPGDDEYKKYKDNTWTLTPAP